MHATATAATRHASARISAPRPTRVARPCARAPVGTKMERVIRKLL